MKKRNLKLSKEQIQILWSACDIHIFVRCYPAIAEDKRAKIIALADVIEKQFPKDIDDISML